MLLDTREIYGLHRPYRVILDIDTSYTYILYFAISTAFAAASSSPSAGRNIPKPKRVSLYLSRRRTSAVHSNSPKGKIFNPLSLIILQTRVPSVNILPMSIPPLPCNSLLRLVLLGTLQPDDKRDRELELLGGLDDTLGDDLGVEDWMSERIGRRYEAHSRHIA